MAAQINQPPTPPVNLQPGLPKLVNDIILQSIAKAPEQRFQSADAFRQAVKQAGRDMQNEVTLVRGSQEIPANAVAPLSNHDAITAVRGSQEIFLSGTKATPAAARTAPAVTARQQTPEPPAAQPMPTPPPQPTGTGHRGLYMALGALVVVIVLVAAGLYVPRWKKASAANAQDSGTQQVSTTTSSPPTTSSQPQQPAASDNHATEPNPGEVNSNGNGEVVGAQSAGSQRKKPFAGNASLAPSNGGAASSQPPPDTAELDAIEHEIDQLSSRAAAVDSSLDNLQRQQQAAGYGLRGDIASKQASMKMNLAKAQDAINHNDAERAKRYAKMTDADVEAL
jgi:serine/threonine-protein kinase